MQARAYPGQTSLFWQETGRFGVLIGGLLLASYLLTMEWSGSFPRDFAGYVLGRDFLNFWIYGKAAWEPSTVARFYDIAAYNEYLRALVPWEYPTQQWSYPPHLLLQMAPFGLLPYGVAYGLWTALGLGALCLALRDDFSGWREKTTLLLAPAAVFCLVSGQNSLFTAAILIAVFCFLDTRPVLAGILLGLLTTKPQLGLLFPVMLLLTRRWRVLLAAAVTTLFLAALTSAIYGPAIWATYFGPALRMQEYVLHAPSDMIKGLMPTVFMNARIAGLSAVMAYGVHAVMALMAIAATVWVFLRPRDPLLSYGALLAANALLTPYLMSYDLVALSWIALRLYPDASLPERRVLTAIYWLPLVALAMARLGLPGSSLILTGLFVLLLLALVRRSPKPGREKLSWIAS